MIKAINQGIVKTPKPIKFNQNEGKGEPGLPKKGKLTAFKKEKKKAY